MMRTLLFISLLLAPALVFAQGTDFVPLLPSLPGIDTLQTQDSLAPFLSQIYKICIGLAAVLAVLQIMRAGIMYMGGDSITEKKEARGLIGAALAGLLLVLSPVIVFSLINPQILELDIGGDRLRSNVESPGPTSYTVIPATTAEECKKKGGTPTGNPPNILCKAPTTEATTAASYGNCSDYTNFLVTTVDGNCNNAANNDTTYTRIQVNNRCCYGGSIQTGFKCCAVNKKDVTAPLPDATKPITVMEYVDGTTKNYGPLSAADKESFSKFSAACTAARGKVIRTQKTIRDCTAEEEKLMTDVPAERRQYIGCKTVDVGCAL